MTPTTALTIYLSISGLVLVGGLCYAGMSGWGDDAPLMGVLAVIWPLFFVYCAVSWPYWLGVGIRKHRARLAGAATAREQRIERDYQEVQRMIEP